VLPLSHLNLEHVVVDIMFWNVDVSCVAVCYTCYSALSWHLWSE